MALTWLDLSLESGNVLLDISYMSARLSTAVTLIRPMSRVREAEDARHAANGSLGPDSPQSIVTTTRARQAQDHIWSLYRARHHACPVLLTLPASNRLPGRHSLTTLHHPSCCHSPTWL